MFTLLVGNRLLSVPWSLYSNYRYLRTMYTNYFSVKLLIFPRMYALRRENEWSMYIYQTSTKSLILWNNIEQPTSFFIKLLHVQCITMTWIWLATSKQAKHQACTYVIYFFIFCLSSKCYICLKEVFFYKLTDFINIDHQILMSIWTTVYDLVIQKNGYCMDKP